MLNKTIENKISGLQALMSKHHVSKAYLFGSCLGNHFSEESDIDVLVDVDEAIDPVVLGGHLWDLRFELEKLFGRKVDLLTSRSLRNPYLLSEINQTKQLVYG